MPGIGKFNDKVREAGFIVDAQRCECACTARIPENIEISSTWSCHHCQEHLTFHALVYV